MEHSTTELLLKLNSQKQTNTIEDTIEETQRKIVDAASGSNVMKDSYGNSLLAIGTDDKASSFTNYGFSNDTLNWTLWLALYNDSWVFKRAIDKPAQDCVRCGITITCDSDKKDELYRKFTKYRFDMIQLFQWGALFGGSIAVLLFDNISDEELSKPLNTNKVKQSKTMRMYVVDRWYGVSPSYDELVTDMKNIDFGKPKYYTVSFVDGHTIKVHHDYVLRYEHRVAPQLVKKGQLQGWGYAEGSHIINELSRDDKLKASIQSLVDKSLIEVIKMSGMRGVFMGADANNELQLRKRLEMVNWGRNFNSLTFLDKDDDYSQNSYGGLSGLSELLQQNMWLISSALEMQGILFGDMKSGFSADEQALERYDETIQGRCESYVRPVYEKLLSIFFKIEGIDEHVEFSFNSLLMKKQDEERMEGLNKFVDLCSKLLGDGVLSTRLYGASLQNFITNGVIDFGLNEDELDKLDDKMEEELEGIEV